MRLRLFRDTSGIVLGSLLLFFGTSNFILAYTVEYHYILAIISGIIICLIGSGLVAISLYSFFKTNLLNLSILLMGGTLLSLSIAIFINPQLVLDVLATFLSVAFFISAGLLLIYSIKGLYFKTRFFTAIIGLILAVICIILGVLLIVEEHISEISFVLIVIGCIVNFIGLSALFICTFDLVRLKKKKAAMEDSIIIDDSQSEN